MPKYGRIRIKNASDLEESEKNPQTPPHHNALTFFQPFGMICLFRQESKLISVTESSARVEKAFESFAIPSKVAEPQRLRISQFTAQRDLFSDI